MLEHCNGVYGKDGPGVPRYWPGRPDLTDHGEAGAIRAASASEMLSTFCPSRSRHACCRSALHCAPSPTSASAAYLPVSARPSANVYVPRPSFLPALYSPS